MNRIATSMLLAGALLVTAVPTSLAGVPSAANSSLPNCMVFCPMGDIPFTVTVRDVANIPVAGSTVVISFAGCPDSAFICAQKPSDPYIVDQALHSLRMTADASGTVTFPARVGGVGPVGCAAVFADGVLLRNYALASPDQNGDGVVIALFGPDLPLFNAKFGTANPTADFDCSGGPVNAADQLIFNQHLAHSCDGFVDPVQKRSWGTLKQHYR